MIPHSWNETPRFPLPCPTSEPLAELTEATDRPVRTRAPWAAKDFRVEQRLESVAWGFGLEPVTGGVFTPASGEMFSGASHRARTR